MPQEAALSDVLAGRRILLPVSRRADDLAAALERHGAETVIVEPIQTINHIDDATLLRHTRQLIAAPPTAVAITTGVGFRGWLEAAESAGMAEDLLAMLRDCRVYARGPKATGALIRAGIEVAWTAASETAEEMIAEIARAISAGEMTNTPSAQDESGRLDVRPQIAVQHHGAVDIRFAEGLAGMADVRGLTVYTWAPAPDPEALRRSTVDAATGVYDAILFTSAPGVRAWLDAAHEVGEENFRALMELCGIGEAGRGTQGMGAVGISVPAGPLIAAVGPVTAKPLEEVGIHPLQPERMRMGALVKAVVRALSRY